LEYDTSPSSSSAALLKTASLLASAKLTLRWPLVAVDISTEFSQAIGPCLCGKSTIIPFIFLEEEKQLWCGWKGVGSMVAELKVALRTIVANQIS
jgi:hypothetical protein